MRLENEKLEYLKEQNTRAFKNMGKLEKNYEFLMKNDQRYNPYHLKTIEGLEEYLSLND